MNFNMDSGGERVNRLKQRKNALKCRVLPSHVCAPLTLDCFSISDEI